VAHLRLIINQSTDVMIVIVVDTDSDMRAAELLVSVEIDLGDLRRTCGWFRRRGV
jgi:hypothetical protein